MSKNILISSPMTRSSNLTQIAYRSEIDQAYFESFTDDQSFKAEINADKRTLSEFELVNSEGQKKIFNLNSKHLGKLVNKFLNPLVYIETKSVKVNTTRFSFPVLEIGRKFSQVLKSSLQ